MNQAIPAHRRWTLADTAILSALTALAFIGTLTIRFPIPATTGYFNVGDIFVILAGLWRGPLFGLLVGAIGPTLADAIGFPQFIPATLIVKGFEGWLVGFISGYRQQGGVSRRIAAAFAGSACMVAGYFVFEAFIYPWVGEVVPFFRVTDMGAAIVEILPNIVQGSVGAVVGLGLWRAIVGTPAEPAESSS